MKKKLSILIALVLAVSLLMVPVAVSAAVPTFPLSPPHTIVVTSGLTYPDPQTLEGFDAEPHTTVVDTVAYDAQNTSEVTIEGEVSLLDLGAGWLDTAYLEIGLRPEATMDLRNAGVYLIAFNLPGDGGTRIHLQDYTGNGNEDLGNDVIDIAGPLAGFRYEITLTPDGAVGGTATLKVWVGEVEVLQTPEPSIEYGYASTWEEDVPAGEITEDFSKAHLFYSIIAECRGTEGIPYSATVGAITITGADLCNTVVVTASFTPRIGLSVLPTSVDFGPVTPGVATTGGESVTVTNTGDVSEDFSAEILNESHSPVYANGLTIAESLVSVWGASGVEAGVSTEPLPLVLTVPDETSPGTYTATIIFWAEAATP